MGLVPLFFSLSRVRSRDYGVSIIRRREDFFASGGRSPPYGCWQHGDGWLAAAGGAAGAVSGSARTLVARPECHAWCWKTPFARPVSRARQGRGLSRDQDRAPAREDDISGLRQPSWRRISRCLVVSKAALLARSRCGDRAEGDSGGKERLRGRAKSVSPLHGRPPEFCPGSRR